MNCSAIRLSDRKNVNRLQNFMHVRPSEKVVIISDAFHSYEFRADHPIKPWKDPDPYLREVTLELPEDAIKFNTGSSLKKWSSKRPRLKSTKGQNQQNKSGKSDLKPSKVKNEDSSTTPENLEEKQNFGESQGNSRTPSEKYISRMEDATSSKRLTFAESQELSIHEQNCNGDLYDIENCKNDEEYKNDNDNENNEDYVDPDIAKLIEELEKASREPLQEEKDKRKRRRKKEKKHEKTCECEDQNAKERRREKRRIKKILRTISVNLSKPASPQTEQVIRVDVTSNVSVEEELVEEDKEENANSEEKGKISPNKNFGGRRKLHGFKLEGGASRAKVNVEEELKDFTLSGRKIN